MRTILEDIVKSGARAGNVINHVRGLLRKEQGPHKKVDLNRLVQEVVRIMRPELLLHQVRLVLKLDSATTEVSGDGIELQQILINLIMNGIEAVNAAPIPDRQLSIATFASDGDVELTVEDAGVGVAPGRLKNIFEPFFSTKVGGMGMGLAICAEIARAHHARLWAENNAERGITMHFRLPASKPA